MKQELSSGKEAAGKPAKRAEKNLYEPYSTPRILYELIRLAAYIIIALTMRIHLRGRYNIPARGPYIIVANHLSWTDIPLVPAYVPGKVVYMAKEEVFTGKLSWVGRFLGAFPVKRHEADRQAIRTSEDVLKKGKVLVIFPEGTRSKTHTMTKAFAGLGMIALRSGAPVLPVAIWGSEHALKKLGADVYISYGKPMVLKPKGKKITREDIDEATDEVMRQIAAMLPERYRGVYGEGEHEE